MAGETMTCPHCQRPRLTATHKTIKGGVRVRVPHPHHRQAPDGTLTDQWCPQGQPTGRSPR